MLEYLPLAIILALFLAVAALGFLDRRKKRRAVEVVPPLSFVVPCYNDAGSVGQTIASIYAVCGADVDVIVADDGSSDGSRELLEALRDRYGFTLVCNDRNLGKSRTLNACFELARHDLVVFTDADVIVNERSLHDAIARLGDSRVGAVSCPYAPQNSGLIPLMQHIEYNMLSFIQGAYNCFSAIALWGGFIVIRKKAFRDAGAFTPNAITEDMDLAFKLNEVGWRVEQSFLPVRTYVPDTLRKWFRQKLRWSAGGSQCFLKHYKVWLKNPLHVVFIFAYCILLCVAVAKLGRDVVLWGDLLDGVRSLGGQQTLALGLRLTDPFYGVNVLSALGWRLSFTVLSVPFVWPLIWAPRQLHRLLLVVPYSIFYVPLFSLISVLGLASFLRRRRRLQTAVRAW